MVDAKICPDDLQSVFSWMAFVDIALVRLMYSCWLNLLSVLWIYWQKMLCRFLRFLIVCNCLFARAVMVMFYMYFCYTASVLLRVEFLGCSAYYPSIHWKIGMMLCDMMQEIAASREGKSYYDLSNRSIWHRWCDVMFAQELCCNYLWEVLLIFSCSKACCVSRECHSQRAFK